MYYIYHIPNVKIGVSQNPKNRVENQGYINFQILEEHTDVVIASKREKELQRQYGYRVDRPDYSSTLEIGLIGAKSKSQAKVNAARQNIKIATAAAVLAGAAGKAGKVAANKERKCPYCGKEGKGPTMYRYHYENCKHK